MSELSDRKDIPQKDRPLFFALLFLPCLQIRVIVDNDIWFLLNGGRYVFAHGIPYIEPFTIHQGFAFVMQQWLSGCIFWAIYSAFNFVGLKILVLLCFALIIYILFKLCMKITGNYFFISFCTALFSSLMIRTFMVERPFIFSTLILAAELYVLESDLLSDGRKYLYVLPVLSLLLINLHASIWPMLFVILLPYFIDSFRINIGPIKTQGFKRRGLVLATGAMLVCGFVNPYGIDAMLYLTKSYGIREINALVMEMFPPTINSNIGLIIFGSLFLLILIYILYRKGTTKLRYVLLTIGTAYMTLSSIRSLSFFALCGTFPLAYYLKDFEPPAAAKSEENKHPLLLRKILTGVILLLVCALIFNNAASYEKSNQNYRLLGETVSYIQNEERTSPVKLYTGYNDGGFTEYMGIPSYLDARADVFIKKNNKKEDVLKEFYQLQTGALYYKDFLNKYQFTHLILTENDILYILLKNDVNYKIVYSNEKYTLFERA